MNIQISKYVVPILFVAIGLGLAMFLLPIIGAIIIGAFALMALLWLSGKVFSFFQGGRDYSEENPADSYRSEVSRKARMLSKTWRRSEVVDAEIISEEKDVKKN